MNDTVLRVTMLGKFEISSVQGTLDEDGMRSDMLERLLVCILLHRERSVSVQELGDALWDGDETENPGGALKNLMYRLRVLLKKTLGDAEYILTSRGGYCWNPEIQVMSDVEQFELLVEQAKTAQDRQERTACYECAVELYQGELVPRLMDRHWIMTRSVYDHSALLSAIKSLGCIYMEEERYEDVEDLLAKALTFDETDEWFYCTIITSLIRQNKQQLAQQYYERAVKILHDALGIRNSAPLAAIHEELLKMNKGIEEEDIGKVCEDLMEGGG